MSGETSLLNSLARSKLHSSVTGKDKTSLHRWVLLKNSVIASLPPTPSPALDSSPSLSADDTEADDQGIADEDVDSFMFPDVGKFVQGPTVESNDSEAQWLDSLLESLGDDEDYDEPDAHSLSVDEDEDQLLSPLPSPMSSSDDLTSYYPPPLYPPLSVPYSVPYDPPHYSFNSTPIPHPIDTPLPYYDQDDLEEELSVPDAIEDTSDDESEDPTTPSLTRSRSSISLADPASIPLPIERSRLRHSRPYIYIDSDDSYFYPFDPLPFPHDRFSSYDTYQEC